MTQEEKDLLLKDLCSRLTYGVIVHHTVINCDYILTGCLTDGRILVETIENHIGLTPTSINECKPYLRPMSSMTEEEISHCNYLLLHMEDSLSYYDYLNSIHIDYRGLIPMGLAIEVTEENNPYKPYKH